MGRCEDALSPCEEALGVDRMRPGTHRRPTPPTSSPLGSAAADAHPAFPPFPTRADEDAAIAGALASFVASLPSPNSPLGSAEPSPGAGSGSGDARMNRFFSGALPWSDWEIRPDGGWWCDVVR